MLEEVRTGAARFRPGPGALHTWPHHFDMALVIALEEGGARSIDAGISPGDQYYAQPYAYVSPHPLPTAVELPDLPAGGRWHTKDFFGAVATAQDILELPEPRAALLAFMAGAIEGASKLLKSEPPAPPA